MSLIKTLTGIIEAEKVSGELPSRDFRSAWRHDGTVVTIDPAAKREILLPLVKEEAQRRIVALTGASDLTSCLIKQHNAAMRAIELNDARATNDGWNEAEALEAQGLRLLAEKIKQVRAASNALEAMDPIPDDYTAQKYWPEGT